MFTRFSNAWLSWVTGNPRTVLALIVVVLLISGLGLPKFKLDASGDSLTLEHDTDLSYFREVSQDYGSGDFLVLTYSPKEDLFSDPSLHRLRELQNDLAQIPGISSVNSILNVPLLYSPKQSIREISKNPRTLETLGVDRQLAKEEFLNSPIYKKLILGPDGQTTALQLNIAVDEKYIDLVLRRDALREKKYQQTITLNEMQELDQVSQAFLEHRTVSEAQGHQRVKDVREVVGKYSSDATIFVGGITMITADMISFIRKDLVVFGSAAVLFMIAVLAVIFRNIRFVLLPMATCLSAVFFMLGYISWLDWRLTVISSNFVALLLIISLAIIIHLVVRYKEYAEEYPDWDQRQLVEATLRFMAKPCIYTSLTTIVAFASLVVSDIRPVIDFGWMMTIGLVVALVLAFLLLPATLMLLKRPEPVQKKLNEKTQAHKPLTVYCSKIVEKRGGGVLLVSVVLGVLSVIGLMNLQVENRFIDYFHDRTEIHKGLSVIDEKLGGTITLDIIIDAKAVPALVDDDDIPVEFTDEDDPFAEADPFDEGDPFASPNFDAENDPFAEADPLSEHGEATPNYWLTVVGMEEVESIHDYLDGLPEVGKVQSLATLYKVGKDINGSLNNFELAILDKALSPEVRDVLVSPYLKGGAETRINMRIKDSYPDLKRAELVERIRSDLAGMGLNMEHVHFTGLLVLYNNMLQSLFQSQIVTLGAVFLGIMFMFLILFRSFSVALVAIVPNILAAFCILGGMGLAGIPLDMMTITIAAITVGIGVDDTIHYIHRFKTELTKDGNYMEAMHRSHASIGRAMYYTSLIIIFGFSIMVLSEFIPTIYFGVLTGLAMLAALSGALFLLPKLILMVRPFSVAERS